MRAGRFVNAGTVLVTLLVALALWIPFGHKAGAGRQDEQLVPKFRVDPFWPKPLPNRWILGQVAGVAVDAHDHIWIIQRPRSLTDDEKGATLTPPRSTCCFPAPPVMEFDAEGNFIQGWGGAGAGYEWPAGEHGIFVDHEDNVWVAGNAENDHQVLKFTRDGTFLMQIGRAGRTGGDNDTTLLGRPADTEVDAGTGEVYVADGYRNHRVRTLLRETGKILGKFGRHGRYAGQFQWIHNLAVDSKGNIYTAEVDTGKRTQKFVLLGNFPVDE